MRAEVGLRRNGCGSFLRRHGQDCHDEAVRRAETRQERPVSLESSWSIGYDCGLTSEEWEVPAYDRGAETGERVFAGGTSKIAVCLRGT